MAGDKPYSQASENNKRPILQVLARRFAAPGRVLEIGAGTGQHAAFFAVELAHLDWQPSDRAENLPSVRAWREAAGPPANLREPIELDVTGAWPASVFDYVFSANTVHIMGWPAVEALLRGVAAHLAPGGVFCLYGPFQYGGEHTAASNARFDEWLRGRDPASGIRDKHALDRLASAAGLEPLGDEPMPANNRVLSWRRLDDGGS